MDVHANDWSELAGRLANNYGEAFEPDRRKELRPKLVRILTRELGDVERDHVVASLDDVLRRTKVTIDWNRFLCIILSSLPGTWTKLTNNPGFNASTMLLLLDGTVMCQQEGGLNWKKLTPDSSGSYLNGTWSDLAPMHWTRRYYASAVLKDGRVFVSGGEYSNAGSETNKSEIYDPRTDTWTEISPPPGFGRVGDAACAVLPDGRVLLGHIDSTKTAIYDPVTDTWTAGPLKQVSSSEESWVLLPDDTVHHRSLQQLAARRQVRRRREHVGERRHAAREPHRDRVVGNRRRRAALRRTRVLRRRDGSHRALHAAGDRHRPGHVGGRARLPERLVGPDRRLQGHAVVPADERPRARRGRAGRRRQQTTGSRRRSSTCSTAAARSRASRTRRTRPDVPYIGRMLLVPTGQVLFAAQTNAIYAYSYFSCPDPAWRPQITSAPPLVRPGLSYSVSGQRFNGLSQAVGYGDDAAAATNYPLVRIRHHASGRVRYCRTFGHSTMGVATGSTTVSTNFAVPVQHRRGTVGAVRRRERHLVAVRADRRGVVPPPVPRLGGVGAPDRQPRRRRPVGARPERPDPGRSVGAEGRARSGRRAEEGARRAEDAREARERGLRRAPRRSARGRGRARRGERGSRRGRRRRERRGEAAQRRGTTKKKK